MALLIVHGWFWCYKDLLARYSLFKSHAFMISSIPLMGFTHGRIFYYPPFSDSKPLAHDSVLAEIDLSNELQPHLYLPINDINIREFKPGDLADIQQIFNECRPDMVENSSETNVGNYWLEENWAERTLVAEIRGEVVGCMEYNKLGLIGIPGVKTNYQGKGIGSALLYKLLLNMKSDGYMKALADTGVILPNAIKLYRKSNFNTSRELWAWLKVV